MQKTGQLAMLRYLVWAMNNFSTAVKAAKAKYIFSFSIFLGVNSKIETSKFWSFNGTFSDVFNPKKKSQQLGFWSYLQLNRISALPFKKNQNTPSCRGFSEKLRIHARFLPPAFLNSKTFVRRPHVERAYTLWQNLNLDVKIVCSEIQLKSQER